MTPNVRDATRERTTRGVDRVTGVHLWILLVATSLLAASDHAYRTYRLYLAPAGATTCAAVAVVAGLGLGLIVGRGLRHRPSPPVFSILLGNALAAAASSTLPFLAFDVRGASTFTAAACLAVITTFLTLSVTSLRVTGRAALSLGFLEFAGSPLRILAIGGWLGAGAALGAHAGFLRTGFIVAALSAVSAAEYGRVHAILEGSIPGGAWGRRSVATLTAAGALVAGGVLAEHWLPRTELARYPDELVFASNRGAHRFVVAAAPGGYELFTDAQLTLSSLDEARRAAALVRPALAVDRAPRRVLLLHGGTGSVEREILRDDRVTSLTVVADAELVRLGRNLAWLSSRTGASLDSPRVRLITREPIVWLAGETSSFDVILDDLPAPIGYGEGKYYTKHYVELLARRLTDGGVFVIPATSAFATKDAFASVLATVESTGVTTLPYHAAIPTLGLTSFVIGSRSPLSRSTLDLTEGVAFDTGRDLGTTGPGAVSTLADQRVVAAFHEERDGRSELGSPPEP